MKPARIKFLTAEEGGREAPPQNEVAFNYRTNASPTTDHKDANWTLVVEFNQSPVAGEWSDCKVNYLAYSHPQCPPLTPDTGLYMFEGYRIAALVKVNQ